RWTAIPPPRRCHAPDAWNSAESSASLQQRRSGAICASSSRRSSDSDTFELQQPTLVVVAVRAPAAEPADGDDAVHGQEGREVAASAERPRGARRARPSGAERELAVGDHLAARHLAELPRARAVEPVRQHERHVEEVVRLALEPADETVAQTLD